MKLICGKPKRTQCKTCPLYKADHVKSWYIPTFYFPNEDGSVDIFSVGEGPGSIEDEDGEGWVGPAGILLRTAIQRENDDSLVGCAFGNIGKCRAADRKGPNSWKDRPPTTEEMEACTPYLERDIKKLKPKVVLLLGNTAIHHFFPHEPGVTQCRGKTVEKDGIIFVLAYHPSFVLRQGGKDSDEYREFIADIRLALRESGRIKTPRSATERGLPDSGKSILVKTVEKVRWIVSKILSLKRGSVCAVDTETRNLNRIRDNAILSIQFCWDGNKAYVIPLRHPKTPFTADEINEIYRLLIMLFTSSKVRFDENGIVNSILRIGANHRASKREKKARKVTTVENFIWLFHNAKFDLHQIRRELGIEVTNNPIVDTMQVAFLLDENRLAQTRDDPKEFYYPDGTPGLSLDILVQTYLGEDYAYDKADKSARSTIQHWRLKRFVDYSGSDVWKLWRLFNELLDEADRQGYRKQLLKLLMYLYSGANSAIVEMEQNGQLADLEHLRKMQTLESPILSEMKRLGDDFRRQPAVKKLNKRLTRKQGNSSHFVFMGPPWLVQMSKKDQMRDLFFDILDYEPVSWTKPSDAHPDGTPQVNKEFYEAYAEHDDNGNPTNVVAIVSDWTALSTLHNNFAKKLYTYVHPDRGHPDMAHDARIRASQGLANTVTGRLNTIDPNQSQVPRVDGKPSRKAVKDIFIAAPGRVMVAFDLMGNEVRWGANCSGDKALGKLFRRGKQARNKYRNYADNLPRKYYDLYIEYLDLEKSAKFDDEGRPLNSEAKHIRELKKIGGKKLRRLLELRLSSELMGDIHKMTASDFYGVPVESVTKILRTDTKGIVFGHMYGRSPRSIAQQIKRDIDETIELLERFDSKFPQFSERLNSWPDEAEELGYVESPIGRRRRFHRKIWEAAGSKQWDWLVARARRQAKNSPIQGVASDSCLIAISIIHQYIREHKKNWLILNIVHDAIYVEVPFDQIAEAIEIFEWAITVATMDYMHEYFQVDFVAPLECDFRVGFAWGSLIGWDFSKPHLELIISKLRKQHQIRWGCSPEDGIKKYPNMQTNRVNLRKIV